MNAEPIWPAAPKKLFVRRAAIGAELAPRQVIARIDRSLFLYLLGWRYDMLEWL